MNEKSCGAVIFYCDNNHKYFLVEKMLQGHYSLCKGHVEDNETEHETALREIFEETGLRVSFIDGFRETVQYRVQNGNLKTVVYFLALSDGMEVNAQLSEVRDILWLEHDDALKLISYDSDREILTKANNFISNNYRLMGC